MSDPTRRPLNFPPNHIPYLEKHRIYELLYEVARELVIQQPSDHVLFTKQILQNAARARDVARVLFLKSNRINCTEVAIEMAKITKQVVITESMLTKCIGRDLDDCPPEIIVKCLAYLVRTGNAYNDGWIMVECIRNETEAKLLLQHGILPTHVFYLIAPFHPDLSKLLYCNILPDWPEYRRNIARIRDVFKKVLKEIPLGKRNVPEIVHDCVELSKIRNAAKGIRARVVLIGPRGSGRKTQAKLLVDTLDIIHVDFEHLICQAWMAESELGKKLRSCRKEVCFHSELLSQVINKRILEYDCLEKGWVLTGYPYTDSDLKYLDTLDTPPNRVIFLECDLNVCKERLRYRRVNVYTGTLTNIKDDPYADHDKELRAHPKDHEDMIEAELSYYCQNYGRLRKYCGETASVVNGDQNERWVYECIAAIIFRAPPPAPPRKGLADTDGSSSSSSSYVCDCLSIPSKVVDCYMSTV